MVIGDISLSAEDSICATWADRMKKPEWRLHCVGWMENMASRIEGMRRAMGCGAEGQSTWVEGKE